MFDGLTERLSGVFDRLSGRGVLSEKDVEEALREVRVALLEADVALPVVKDFIAKAKERATGEDVIRSVRPADQVVKIVYDGLVETLGGEEPTPLDLAANPPAVIWCFASKDLARLTQGVQRLQDWLHQAGAR